MKTSICFFITILMLVTTQSYAQQRPAKADNLQEYEHARKLKNAGATLTVMGGVLMIVDGLTLRNSIRNGESGGEVGFVCYVVGIGGLASGIPMMAVGSRNMKKYQQKTPDNLSVRINANPRSTGLTFTYRF